MKRIIKYIIALSAPVIISGTMNAQIVTDSVCPNQEICVTTPAFRGTIQWQYSIDAMASWVDAPSGTNDTICFTPTFNVHARGVILENTCDSFFTDTHFIFVRNYERTATFNFTGGIQTWTAPSDVCDSILIKCWGASGGAGATGGSSTAGGNGGLGGYTEAYFPVTPGMVFQVFVGGEGATPTGGFNGGANGGSTNAGGGGGASDVRYPGTSEAERIIVGGGGGGGGRAGCETASAGVGGNGGGGGGASGTNGGDSPTSGGVAGGGFGGTVGTGGNAGIGCSGFLGSPGSATATGTGGAGGAGQSCCCFSFGSIPGGGGGGGGMIGGGGGGGGSAGTSGCSGNDKGAGGGGAGGSSAAPAGAHVVTNNGIWVGNGQVIIAW